MENESNMNDYNKRIENVNSKKQSKLYIDVNIYF